MADVRCPMCGKTNPSELDTCQFCGARLKPLSAAEPENPASIKVGEEPVKKNTAEFEKVNYDKSEPVQPGEAPTKKNTAELEHALPAWLRSLREGKDESTTEAVADQEIPLGSAPTNPVSSNDSSDWLSGLGKAASDDEEETPDWLAGLRENSAGSSEPAPEPGPDKADSLSAGPGDTDWMSRLGKDLQPPESAPEEEGQGEAESPARLDSQKPEAAVPGEQEPAADMTGDLSAGLGEMDWVGRLGEEEPQTPESVLEGMVQDKAESPARPLSQESEPATPIEPEQPIAPQENETPDWLSEISTSTEETPPPASRAEELPDWLNQLKAKSIESQDSEGTAAGADIPDWLANYEPTPETPETSQPAAGESLPDWLSNLGANTDSESTAPGSIFSNGPPPSGTAGDEIPDWLSQFQTDANAAEEKEAKEEQFEQAPPIPASDKGTEPVPEWLAGINSAPSSSDKTPALIASDESAAFSEKDDTAFSMETPDWLSKLKPENNEEDAHAGDAEASGLENLDKSELPSWVQAMRPVESVVAEAKPAPQEDARMTVQSGPLAGLQGVLPIGPGLGQLRKPPAYSTILQVTDGQQRYATALERLISSETQPRVAKDSRLGSSRLWRWLIAGLLILAVIFPLITGFPVTQPSTLQPPEMVAAYKQIDNLTSKGNNPPVLVVFDYEPAYSGELEAAATPLMDYLILNKAPHLALISTSPTGPALAERFFTDKTASPLIAGHSYQTGQDYVNLGYLAGGPAGVSYFAMSPTQATPFSVVGQPAWLSPSPLQGIKTLSDFAAIIVLTDNADSGRTWIEQTGSAIGATPMLMVISAQAEPLILPYYDSGQIKGVVTGLAGGEASERTYIRPDSQAGLAQSYWDSFSAGIFIAVILIAAGALWSAVTAWRHRHEKEGEGA